MSSGCLLVEASSEESALRLVDELRGLHAELSPGDGARCVVAIEFDRMNDRWLSSVVDALQSWLTRAAVGTARIRLDGRSYVFERPAE